MSGSASAKAVQRASTPQRHESSALDERAKVVGHRQRVAASATAPSATAPSAATAAAGIAKRAGHADLHSAAGSNASSSLCVERRLLHWNILDGGGGRRDGICAYLRDGQYDLVTLNELNGFSGAALAQWGQECGYAHSLLLSKSAYHLGILSRHQLSTIVKERGPTFAHGLLCARVLGVSLVLIACS